MEKVLRDKKAISLFILPSFILFTCVVFIPIIWTVCYTFYDGMPGLDFKFVGFKNYITTATDSSLWAYFFTNIEYVVTVVIGQIAIGLIMGFIVLLCVKKYTNAIKIALFTPVIFPTVAVAELFSKIFEIAPQYGFVNGLLQILGMNNLVQAWTGNVSTALWTVCVMDIWRAVGMYALIFYSAIADVPEDIIEAAKIDGAGILRIIRTFYLPMIRSILSVCIVLSLTGTFKVYESVLALTNGGPGTATYVLSMYMYNAAFMYSEYGYGSVIALIILVECLAASLVVYKIFSKDNMS